MLHRHVETLLEHWVFVVNVGTRSYVLSCRWLVLISIVTFALESAFACVKDNCVLKVLVPRLAVCVWSLSLCCIRTCVLSWPWHLKLKALTIEYLVIVESRWCRIKTNFLSCVSLIISCSCLPRPLRSFVEVRDYSTCSSSCWSIADVYACGRWTSRTYSLPCLLGIKNPNVWVLSINLHEAISCWFEEYTLWHRSFLLVWCRMRRPIISKFTLFYIFHLSLDSFLNYIVILTRPWTILWLEYSWLQTLSIASKGT